MQTLTQPLRDEHRRFAAPVRAIGQAAAEVSELPIPELRARVDRIVAFLRDEFLPHAHAEEVAVYPLAGRVAGTPLATQTMERDHQEVTRLAHKLVALRERLVYSYFGPSEIRALRAVLYDLRAILVLHLAKEDEIVLPLLDAHLSAAEAIEMIDEVRIVEAGEPAPHPEASASLGSFGLRWLHVRNGHSA